MKISYKQLNNLSVYTQNQQFIGRVGDIVINTDTHAIKKYLIKKSSLVKELISALAQEKDLEVSPSQVISINKDKMIVQDNVASDRIGQEGKNKSAVAMPAALSQANEQ